jgi:CRP-like cAMP-binding protein
MTVHRSLPITGSCPCTHAPEVGAYGRCPRVDVQRRKGSVLFAEGEPSAGVWYVKRGCVLLLRESPGGSGDPTPFAIRRAGSFVGIEGLVSRTYLYTARVTSPSILAYGGREVVESWLSNGASARMVLEQVLRTECQDAPRAATTDGSAQERVARWILAESERGTLSQVPRCFVAGLLGMAPETFSRALTGLGKAGAVEITRRTLRVRDAQILRRYAESAKEVRVPACVGGAVEDASGRGGPA